MSMDSLAQVLLDFGRTPGRYALRLREPRELHTQLDTVALWAQGRLPDALQAQAQDLKAAAVLFIQRACFAQENTHYQVLGLLPNQVEPDLLRARYRSLIRLTHPDMGVEGLPSGAAGMVNRAQEVLANPELREKYDEQLEGSARPSWQGVAVASAPLAADGHSVQRRRLDHHDHGGLGERWRTLWARYPTQARLLLTATGIGLLVMALLAWAANDAPGGALVVVRPPAQASDAKDQTVPNPTVQTSGPVPTAKTASSSTMVARNSEGVKPNVDLERDIPRAVTPPQPPRTVDVIPTERSGVEARAPLAAPSTPQPELVAKALAAKGSDMRTRAEASAPQPKILVTVQAADTPPSVTTPATHPTPAGTTAAAPSRARAAAETTTAAAAAPAPPADTSPQWTVDVPGATQYLRDLMMLLERPQEASRTN
ncbi:MAG: DnaJ domain-containing protein, partial [Giesbergeria sp.]